MEALRNLVEHLAVDARRLVIVSRELADNALYHSGEGGGWCIVGKTEERLVVAVRDTGVGIHATMREAYPDIDESMAVTAAFSGGVTSEASPIRGLGFDDGSRLHGNGSQPVAGDRRCGFCRYRRDRTVDR